MFTFVTVDIVASPSHEFWSFKCERLNLSYLPPREAGVMVQQLDVVCGDVSVDLSEDLLIGEAGLLKSLRESSRSRNLGEAHGVPATEPSMPEVGHPAPSSDHGATSAPASASIGVVDGAESGRISLAPEAGAGAASATAIAESAPNGRVVKVPEKVGDISLGIPSVDSLNDSMFRL